MTFDTRFVRNHKYINQMLDYVEAGCFTHVAFDLETDSIREKTAKIVGIGLSFDENVAFYIPIRDPNLNLLWSNVDLAYLYELIFSICSTYKLIGHNIIYDVLVFENNSGYNLSSHIHSDTILMKHALDEERPFGLKEIAVKYLGAWADKAQQDLYASITRNGGKTSKDQLEMYKADTDILGTYCGWDVCLTFRLYNLFEARLVAENLHDLFYKEETMPLYREVAIDMKRRGFVVDVAYFEELKRSIGEDINRLEDEILVEIKPLIDEFIQQKLDDEVPVKNKGSFPPAMVAYLDLPLPRNKKTGAVSFARPAIEAVLPQVPESDRDIYRWLLGEIECPLTPYMKRRIQEKMYLMREERRHIFNLRSDAHLRWLFFTKLEMDPVKFTDSGEASVAAEVLNEMAGQNPFADQIINYKKLTKLDGTYVQGILDRQIDGVIYTAYLLFGTTSGRFSSRDPNLQNLPRIKDEESKLSALVLTYTNAIKRGFIAPAGYVIVNADYSALEPMCFAHMSGDERLREVFRKGHDLYSTIAIDVFGLHEYSADKKAHNYLGKHKKEARQKAKIFCLAVPYGAEAGRISKAMNMDYQEAQELIDAYLDAYPGLRKYMSRCQSEATRSGKVITEFGRVRHLPLAKDLIARYGAQLLNRRWAKEHDLADTRYKLKNQLNNSMNFPIQGLAAHIVNRSMIALARAYRAHGIEGCIVGQCHDELTAVIRADQAELAAKLMQEAMETTTVISVPLQAVPIIAKNWAEAK